MTSRQLLRVHIGRVAFHLAVALMSAAGAASAQAGGDGELDGALHGGSEPALAPPRLETAELVLDGRPDEPFWQRAWTVTDFHQLSPNEGDPPSEPTELRLFYDEQALYVAVRVYEAHPSAIIDRDLERNGYHRSDQDGIGVILDTNNDGRTAYGFIVTPSGARTDVAVFDDRRVNWNTDWNSFWDAESARDEAGWSVEMRIPFSALRFQPDGSGEVRMGLIVWRYLARNDEFNTFPRIPNNWQNSAYKPSEASPIVFRGIEARNPVFLKPYALGGMVRRSRPREGAEPVAQERDWSYDLGGDLKYNVTSNLILDLTVNTDFAQVEADDVTFQLDRFSLFFPEKRDFFQERSDLFEFGFPGGRERLFHSRTIGIVAGEPIPIRGGVRLTGSHGNWNLGLLNMQTASATVDDRSVPAENFGVARLQRPVLDRGSYVGGMVTSRTDLSSDYNVVYAMDADLHMGDDVFFDVKAAQSAEPDGELLSSSMASVGIQRRVNRGLFYGGSVRHLGPGFHPASGYLRRVGYNRLGVRVGYGWFPGTGSVQNHQVAYRPELFWHHRFEVLETMSHSLSWNIGFRDGSSFDTSVDLTREVLTRPFTVGDLTIPAGRHRFLEATIGYGTASGRSLQAEGELSGGGYFGGSRFSTSLDFAWNPSPYFSLGTENVYNWIRVPDGRYNVVLSRVRVGTALSRTLTASAFIQHDSSDGSLVPNVRIRYNPREGSDLYVVYNEHINTDLLPTDPLSPALPRSQARSIQVKYTYTFVH